MRLLTSTMIVMFLAACPATKPPGEGPGGGRSGTLDPDSCGNVSTSDVGRKLHAFLVATVELDRQVTDMEMAIKGACKTIGTELQMAPADLDGNTKDMCTRVWTTLRADLQAGLGPQHFTADYKPGVCTIDVDAEAKVAAECEAQANATATVTCDGSCTGTCHGACTGTCAGGAAGGDCNGQCQGTCNGSCSGGCQGTSDVHASAECKAQAEVHASASMQCTEPQLTITLPPEGLADQAKANMAVSAMRKGLPKVLWAAARVQPLGHAAQSWATAAENLVDSSGQLAEQLGEQAICVGGQIAAAAAMVAHIQASVQVSIDVSVQASGSMQGGGGTN
jgi:hypothetical protein